MKEREHVENSRTVGRWALVCRSPLFHVLLVAALGLVLYSNTLGAPMQWDDLASGLAGNPIIKDLRYFADPSLAREFPKYDQVMRRYVGYLTFAVNYRLHGLDVKGYHAVNIAVHVATAVFLYVLVLLTFRTPLMRASALAGHGEHIALFASLVFVSHPLQTEAVTYIFQRHASLVAFFYVGSLAFYARWRLNAEQHPSSRSATAPLLYCASLLSAVLAMKTKENAFTLPLVMLLYELAFFKGPFVGRLLRLAPFFLTMLIVPLSVMRGGSPEAGATGGAPPPGSGISGHAYLLTQFRVAATYLRLLLLPVNQNIDYDYPVYTTVLDAGVFLPLILLSAILAMAAYLLFRPAARPEAKLLSFGVLWFFVTLSVESGPVPIPMVINEYRVYLPAAGAAISLATGAALAAGRLGDGRKKTAALVMLALVVVAFSAAARERNAVWGSAVSLWEDAARKSPGKLRPRVNLGSAFMDEGMYDRAEAEFRAALALSPDDAEAHNNLGTIYISLGRLEYAEREFRAALRSRPDMAGARSNLGGVLADRGRYEEAVSEFETALRADPNNARARANLGVVYVRMGRYDEAVQELGEAARLAPEDGSIRESLRAAKALLHERALAGEEAGQARPAGAK